MIKLGQMVLKGVNWVHNALKSGHMVLNGQFTQLGQMVLKGVNWYIMITLGKMVLKGVNCVHNDKIGSNGLERSQLGTQYKNQVIRS